VGGYRFAGKLEKIVILSEAKYLSSIQVRAKNRRDASLRSE